MIHTSMFQKHIHRVKFYPSADDFTQAPLVMLVTNIMSADMMLVMMFCSMKRNRKTLLKENVKSGLKRWV